MKYFLYVFSIIITIAVTGCSSQVAGDDFDKICSYFQEADKNQNSKPVSNKELSTFITTKIQSELSSTSDARIAWDAIMNAVAEQRYALFQSAADSVGDTEWKCDSMNSLIGKII